MPFVKYALSPLNEMEKVHLMDQVAKIESITSTVFFSKNIISNIFVYYYNHSQINQKLLKPKNIKIYH